jgi:PPOX class probable F420-dependent enzyme
MTDTTPRQPPLSESIREFLSADRFATIATLDPDGSPRHAVVWYRLDGDEVVINSLVGRRWPSNLLRDSRISIAVVDARYRWIGITGRARAITDQATAQADIAEMARRYDADKPEQAERTIREEFQRQERISFRIRPLTVYDHVE